MTRRIFASLALAALAALPGCASTELARGDVLRVDRRELPPAATGHRLLLRAPGELALETVRLCPVQERRVYQEVEVRRESAALAAAAGVGCGVQKFGELANITAGRTVVSPSSCAGASFTDRTPTGRTLEGPWETVRREPCGGAQPARAGGRLQLLFIRSGVERAYTLGADGRFRIAPDDLAQLRLYFTLLKGIEVGAKYGEAAWRQKVDLE